jgi:flagellar protein FlaG
MRIGALQPSETPGVAKELPSPASAQSERPDTGKVEAASGKPLPPPLRAAAQDLHVAADLIDQYLRQSGRELSISVDKVTGSLVVAVRDPATGQLIRQIPSEEALRIAQNLEVAGPALIDELA